MTLIKFKNPAINTFDRMPYFSEMVNDFVNGWVTPELRKSFSPAVNIKESEKSFEIQFAVPGMKKEDFKIEVLKDVLTVSAEKKEEQQEKSDNFTRKEFSYTSFTRSFDLPEFLENESIQASYLDGILNITVPKKEESKTKVSKEIKVS